MRSVMSKKNPPTLISSRFTKKKNTEVSTLIGQLEKRTQKQMVAVVKEIVKLKKNQVKLEQKLIKPKATLKSKSKPKTNKPSKKKKDRHLKIVPN